jgi:hypothetical protein
MNALSLPPADITGMLIGLLLTAGVFSYLVGDNALFRLSIHIFIGAAAGYAAVTAWANVLWPQLVRPLLAGNMTERLPLLIPLLLGLMLLGKATSRLNGLGSLPTAYLVGVAAATAVGGAVVGTIFPQALAAMTSFTLPASGEAETDPIQVFNGVLVLLGTVATLAYFHFGARTRPDGTVQRGFLIELLADIGGVFIAVTLGVLFGGVYLAALAALVERMQFILDFLQPFFVR